MKAIGQAGAIPMIFSGWKPATLDTGQKMSASCFAKPLAGLPRGSGLGTSFLSF